MVVERSVLDGFLTNTYLVGTAGGEGFLVDAGGPLESLWAAADRHRIDVTHILLTHHHFDHVCALAAARERHPEAEVLIHPQEADLVDGATGALEPGRTLTIGGLEVTPLHTPGHTAGMVSLLVEGNCFTGDTLFKGSVGGVRAPGHTTFADLRRSVLDILLQLPPETILRPGHAEPTTVADELEHNAFVRVWRGEDPEGDEPCTALGDPARLVLWGDDYDGGHKAWVRWPDGTDDIVPGSQVRRG